MGSSWTQLMDQTRGPNSPHLGKAVEGHAGIVLLYIYMSFIDLAIGVHNTNDMVVPLRPSDGEQADASHEEFTNDVRVDVAWATFCKACV